MLPKNKKTGLLSQGVTEQPGEFSNWHNSGIMQTSNPGLCLTRVEKPQGNERTIFTFAQNSSG